MKRMRRVIQVVLVLMAVASPAAAAEETLEIDASIGLQGYVMPYEATTVSVRVHSDVLFVGDLKVTTGGVSLFSEIEVPAGSTKHYTVDVPMAGSTNRAAVRLFVDGSDRAIAQETLTVLHPGDEPLVGLLGAPNIESQLAEVEVVPFGGGVSTLNLTLDEVDADIAPLGYLVLGTGSLDSATPEQTSAIENWVSAGGRLVGEVGDVEPIAATAGGIPLNGAVTTTNHGAGELIVVRDVGAVDEWQPAIRDLPGTFVSTNEFGGEMGFQMLEAASAGGESTTPGISWLLGAFVVYVLLAGPVNFYILRRMGRRELAWVTIPAISVLMMGFLWVAGRTQVDGKIVTHASVIVQDGSAVRASSALIVVAGEGGEHALDAPAGWQVAPMDASMMFGRSAGVEARVEAAPAGGTRLSFEMPDLAAAALNARWTPDPLSVKATAEATDNALEVTVVNNTDLEFWAWGVGVAGAAQAAPRELGAGETGTQKLVGAFNRFQGGSVIGDAVMSRGGWGWENEPWQKVWPLSETAARQESETLRSGPYFFGYTDDLAPNVTVDGSSEEARGPALVIIPIESPEGFAPATGIGEVVHVVGANFVDSYPGWMYAAGADALELRFEIDAAAGGDVKVRRIEGHMPGIANFEVYNWTTGSFDVYEWLGSFPLAGHVSPTGEVMARITFEESEFNDLDLPTGGITLEEVAS